MTRISTFGAVVASTIAALAGQAADAQMGAAEEKACYRSHCGTSVKGHEGRCGGTKVDELATQEACEEAGGAWTTAAEAKKFEKKEHQ